MKFHTVDAPDISILTIQADNIYEESVNITMGDDGLGNSVSIPSIFVSEETGK